MDVTAAIIRKDDKLLICQRAEEDENCPLQWEFPGGKIEPNESPQQCIVREIKEELELEIVIDSLFATSVYKVNDLVIHFTVYNVTIVDGDMKLNVHKDAKWVTIDELTKFDFMKADMAFVNKLLVD